MDAARPAGSYHPTRIAADMVAAYRIDDGFHPTL
jgi:hypothetical protein